MKKLVLIDIIGVVGWQFHSERNTVAVPTSAPEIFYQCDGRQHCSQMTSYEEAKFFLQNCPDTKMDGDNDGIPCERQFGR